VLLTQLSSLDGADPAAARVSAVTDAGFTVSAQEDRSHDAEVAHVTETVDFLALAGDGLLRGAAQRPVIAETGRAEVGDTPITITLGSRFENPVVLALPATERGGDPAVLRVSDVTTTSFDIRIQEPDSEDGFHLREAFTWLVVEAGDWRLPDGTRLSAGRLESDLLSTEGFENVAFADPFAAMPAVLTQTQTDAGPAWVTTRQRDATPGGFSVTMQEEEASQESGHATETIGWVAIDQGAGFWGGAAFEARVTPDVLTDARDRFEFVNDYGTAPGVLAALASFDGVDPAALRLGTVDREGVTLRVMEERSADAETAHTTESVALLALGAEGLLTGEAWQ
jgi:hypothetical protein